LNNCDVRNSNKLNQLQLEAAKIATGLPVFDSAILYYKVLSGELLAERRKRRRLQMLYKMYIIFKIIMQPVIFVT